MNCDVVILWIVIVVMYGAELSLGGYVYKRNAAKILVHKNEVKRTLKNLKPLIGSFDHLQILDETGSEFWVSIRRI